MPVIEQNLLLLSAPLREREREFKRAEEKENSREMRGLAVGWIERQSNLPHLEKGKLI